MDRMGFGKPLPAAVLDEEYRSGNWDHFWDESEQDRHDVLVEMVFAHCPAPMLLDLGCGSGRLAAMLSSRSITSYLGIDLSSEGLRRALELELPSAQFLHVDYESWCPSSTYNIITFNECLGYAKYPLRTLEKYSRYLEPDGALIVSHFQWGNHEAIWRSLGSRFRFTKERVITTAEGKVWDIKTLQPL